MAFKDWTRLFRRSESHLHPVTDDGSAEDSGGETRIHADADHEKNLSRTALMKELEQGFHQVGRVVERFDEHLGTTNRLMEAVAAEHEQLPALMTELTAAASASRHAHEAMTQQLSQRDEANHKLLAHLSSLSDSFELERDQHRAQLALVMKLQRGGRRLLVLLLLVSFLFITLLLALVLVLALRPDLIGAQTISSPWTTQGQPAAMVEEQQVVAVDPIREALRSAAASDDPAIREAARKLLDE